MKKKKFMSDEEIEEYIYNIMDLMSKTNFTGEVLAIIYRFLREYAQIVTVPADGTPAIHTREEIIDLINFYHKNLMKSLRSGRDT